MHPSNWLQYNPFYLLFYSTTTMAATVAVILAVLLFVALGRQHKEAAIGLGVGLALATTAAVVLSISDKKVDATFASHQATGNYNAPVTGVQFVGTPIVMAVAAVTLFVLAGRYAWVSGRSVDAKLTIVTAFLLGASLFGTFAGQLAQDTYDVGGYYWNNWADFGSWLWAADFILTCAFVSSGLSAITRHPHVGGNLRNKFDFNRKLNFGPDDNPQTHKTTRTADASA